VNLIVGWCRQFLFFIVPCQFSQDIGKWQENQILIPDWTYFHCPGATLMKKLKKKFQAKLEPLRDDFLVLLIIEPQFSFLSQYKSLFHQLKWPKMAKDLY